RRRRRQALRPGHLRSTQLRLQRRRPGEGAGRLPPAAPAGRVGHWTRRAAVRRLLLQPRRPRRVPPDGPGGPGRCWPALPPARAARRRPRPPHHRRFSGRRIPEIRDRASMMSAMPEPAPEPAPARPPELASQAYKWTLGIALALVQSALYFGIGHASF